jgi:hypothetical protein
VFDDMNKNTFSSHHLAVEADYLWLSAVRITNHNIIRWYLFSEVQLDVEVFIHLLH